MGVTHAEFGAKTGALEAAAALGGYIRGKTVLITGVSPKSIGAALALAIASQSPHLLIFASRTPAKIQAVTRDVLSSYPGTTIKEVTIDFSSLNSVRHAAAQIKELLSIEGSGLDVIFNNAGINVSERKLTTEGVELQFATNHLGPFLLTNLLQPLLLKDGDGRRRVVMTSSEAHRISPVRFSDINQTPGAVVNVNDLPRRGMPKGVLRGRGGYEPAVAYGQTKTAQVLFAISLNERLGGLGVHSFAVMPGTIMTGLVQGADGEMLQGMLKSVGEDEWKTLDQGAATLIVAGFDPGLKIEEGVYLNDCQLKRPSKWAADATLARRLWKLSEDLVGEKFETGKGEKSHI